MLPPRPPGPRLEGNALLRSSGPAGTEPRPAADTDSLRRRIESLIAAGDSDPASLLHRIAQLLNTFFKASGTAIALEQGTEILCVASAGETAPDVGTPLNVSAGLSGLCFRTGESQRCFEARSDPRVDAASCKALGIVSILIVPVKEGERTVGLVEVFAQDEFYFNNNDTAELEQAAPLVLKASRVEKQRAMAGSAGRTEAPAAPPLKPQLVVSAPPAPAVAAPELPPAAAEETNVLLAAPETMDVPAAASPSPALPAGSPRRYFLAGIGVLVLVVAGWATARWLFPVNAPPVSSQAEPAPAPAATTALSHSAAPTPTAGAPETAAPQNRPETSAPRPVRPMTAAPLVPETVSTKAQPPALQPPVSGDAAPAKTAPPVTSTPAISQPPAAATEAAPAPPPVNTANLVSPGERLPVNLAAGTAATPVTRPEPPPPSSTVEPERLIRRVNPVYPTIARVSKITGEVVVDITITKEGNVINPVVESGPVMLRAAVLDAVQQWKYKPYMLNGVPQEIRSKIKVNFRQ